MVNLSYQEAYALSFINTTQQNINIKSMLTMLLGFYACDFLDALEERGELTQNAPLQDLIDAYFAPPHLIWDKDTLFLSAVKKLRSLNLLKLNKIKTFEPFSLVHIEGSSEKPISFDTLDTFLIHSIKRYKSLYPMNLKMPGLLRRCSPRNDEGNSVIASKAKQSRNKVSSKKINMEQKEFLKNMIHLFNKKLFSFFQSYETQHSKYELRFFWPSPFSPEIYDVDKHLFHKKDYSRLFNQDDYFLTDIYSDIKRRDNTIQVKDFIHDTYKMAHFTKKRKITQEELERLPQQPIRVNKERYIRKMEDHSKIELSLITVQDKEWKTICLESSKIENVVALSFLINQKKSEILTYPEFLHKYGN